MKLPPKLEQKASLVALKQAARSMPDLAEELGNVCPKCGYKGPEEEFKPEQDEDEE